MNYFHSPLNTFSAAARFPLLCFYCLSAIKMKQVHNSVGLSIFESMLFQEFKGFPHCSLSGYDDSKQNSVVPFQGV